MDGDIDEMPPVRQERREPVGTFVLRLVGRSDRGAGTAGRAHAMNGALLLEQNHVIAVPRARHAGDARRLGQRLRWPAVDGNFFELSGSEERDEAAIGRPERILDAIGAGDPGGARKRLGRHRAEWPNPDLSTCSAALPASEKCDVSAIGRNAW